MLTHYISRNSKLSKT